MQNQTTPYERATRAGLGGRTPDWNAVADVQSLTSMPTDAALSLVGTLGASLAVELSVRALMESA